MHWVTWHTHEHFSQKICKIVGEVAADILLLGTSRCENHYVPSIIQDSTGMSVFNAGISASGSIYFQYVTLAHVLNHHTPKVVVLDTGESEYVENEGHLNMLSFYAPAPSSVPRGAHMLFSDRKPPNRCPGHTSSLVSGMSVSSATEIISDNQHRFFRAVVLWCRIVILLFDLGRKPF